jgi:hypothetical protein
VVLDAGFGSSIWAGKPRMLDPRDKHSTRRGCFSLPRHNRPETSILPDRSEFVRTHHFFSTADSPNNDQGPSASFDADGPWFSLDSTDFQKT